MLYLGKSYNDALDTIEAAIKDEQGEALQACLFDAYFPEPGAWVQLKKSMVCFGVGEEDAPRRILSRTETLMAAYDIRHHNN